MGVKHTNTDVKFGKTIRLGKNTDLDNAVAGEVEVGSLRDTGSYIERWSGTSWEVVAPGNWVRISDTITSTGTLSLADDFVRVDATSGNITINLLSAAAAKNKVHTVMKIDSSAFTVTIDPDGSELINLAATKVITAQLVAWTFVSDGTQWFIIA